MKTYIGLGDSPRNHMKNDINIVYVNSFEGSNYHSFNEVIEITEAMDLENRIKKIKHINKDPETYFASLELYNEYMGSLMDKYGGEALFRVNLRNGTVTEKIPPKPEMKVNSSNRDTWNILKNGGALSKVGSLSMSREKEEDYLRRIGFDETIDNITIEEGEHPPVLQKLIEKSFEYLEEEKKPIKYISPKSLNNFLDMTYGHELDNKKEFTVSLTDLFEDTPRYQELVKSRSIGELENANIHGRWRKCSKEDMDMITAFDSEGWNIGKLSDKFSGDAISETKKSVKRDKKNKKDKKNNDDREDRFGDHAYRTEHREDRYDREERSDNFHDDEIFTNFADYQMDYLNYGSTNIMVH